MNSTQAKEPVNHVELDALAKSREEARLAYQRGKRDRAEGKPRQEKGEDYTDGYDAV